ncbi:thioredoxin family protein [Bacillus benzoevorans]|uniref:Thiol-disulfide isomerase/thioredoxin n=1 Tax=Bacillus benzoevorans TaxID=1456 RepID=A0A7X0HMB8_9BACI|nr:thioredoxin family protein [Bacillus benzoevorans]MBB6443437.1 thiol-disulfide isomerase/thioredoxin [Bacillus benzoevorans]
MKKVLIFLGIIVVLFAVLGLLTNMQNKEKAKGNPYGKDTLYAATVDLLDDENYQNIILPQELEKKLANKEDVTVYFFQSTCEFCKQATPILMPLAEDMGINLVQYNLLEFEEGWDKYRIEGTPTIVQFKKGKETARIKDLRDEATYRQWFEENSQ